MTLNQAQQTAGTHLGDRITNIDYNTARKKYSEIRNSKLILEHHLSFANDCISNSIFPLGLRAFVLCVAYKADDCLEEKWKKVLHNASVELLALCKDHFLVLHVLEKTSVQMHEVERQVEDSKDEMICAWEDRMSLEEEIRSREKEMKGVRNKKIKHAMKIHGEGRVFCEGCLVEKGETRGMKITTAGLP